MLTIELFIVVLPGDVVCVLSGAGGKQMELSRSDDKGSSSSSFDPWRRNPQSSMNLRSRQHKWVSEYNTTMN